METIEAVVAVYGIEDMNGNTLTEKAAMTIVDTLKAQADLQAELPGIMPGSHYRIVDARIEGDRNQGKVYATFEKVV